MNESELLANAFTDPLIEGDLVYKPLRTSDDICRMNSTLLVPAELFFSAYENLHLVSDERLQLNNGETRLLKLIFELGCKEYEAYACEPTIEKKAPWGGVFISSSGNNSVTCGEFSRISPALEGLVDSYLFIKPNEDWIAFHNGKGKLHRNYYVNWLLNHGSSHSAAYIIASMAFVKYLRSIYDRVLVAGCSQGGSAALWNSLQSRPDAAIIASGYSIQFNKVMGSGHNQILLPGLDARYDPPYVRNEIHHGSTSYFLSYGKTDNAWYAYEAANRITFDYMAGPNFTGVAHDGGHEFPASEICEFVKQQG